MSAPDRQEGAGGARDWLRLVRAPNLLTAPGDPLAGAVLTGGFSGRVLLAMAAAAVLYAGGMALNDVLGVAEDCRERPERPLPAGRIRVRNAGRAAALLLLTGLLLATLAGGWTSGGIGLLLIATIVAYNAHFKHTPAGPWVMGACRGQSLLLGAAVSCVTAGTVRPFAPLVAAALITLYTAAVTALARTETARGRIERVHRGPAAAALATTAVIVLALGGGIAGRLIGGALAGAAAAIAAAPAERWNIAAYHRRREMTGRLVGAIVLLQAAFIAAGGGAAVFVGLAWALLVPAHRILARRFVAS